MATLGAQHQPSGLNNTFNGDQLTFADYISATRDLLSKAHIKLGSDNLEKIVDGNAPFELFPPSGFEKGQSKTYKRGIVLTHGLTDSPYWMRHLGYFFQQQGFRIMAILLPGHGTQPGDLLDVHWQEWGKAVAYGVEQISLEVEEIYLAGHSTGGTLSLYHSLHDTRVRGLFLFSPALKISSKAAFATWHKIYSWLIPSAKWLTIKADGDIYKYESITKNAVAQTYALIQQLDQTLRHPEMSPRKIDIPIFAATSNEDTTVHTSATIEFMMQTRHPISKLLLYSAKQEISNIHPKKIEHLNSNIPELRILSYSHLSIILPENDAYYGEKGEYCNCLHYFSNNSEKYFECLHHPEKTLWGEITEENLEKGLLRRLTYNPKFKHLELTMQEFISKLL